MRVEVTPARPEEVPLLRRLMQLYLCRTVGELARQIFDRLPGRWEVVEMASNVDARRDGLGYRAQRFDTGRR